MTHIFYLLTASLLMYELFALMNAKRLLDYSNKVRLAQKEKKKLDLSDNEKALNAFNLFYFAMLVAGLLSSQWIVFLFILLISFIPKRYVIVRYIDTIISIAALIFILVNKYHLHIDLFNLIFN